jgi:hypothetical protein
MERPCMAQRKPYSEWLLTVAQNILVISNVMYGCMQLSSFFDSRMSLKQYPNYMQYTTEHGVHLLLFVARTIYWIHTYMYLISIPDNTCIYLAPVCNLELRRKKFSIGAAPQQSLFREKKLVSPWQQVASFSS